MRLSHPALLIDINGVGGLDRIAVKDGQIEIGALVRHAQARALARHRARMRRSSPWRCPISAIPPSATAARSAARSPSPIRPPSCRPACWRWAAKSRSPARRGRAPSRPTISSRACSRPRSRPRDVLTAIRVPAAGAATRVGFAEFARRHGDYAMVGLAACARADGSRLADRASRLFRRRCDPGTRAQCRIGARRRRHRRRGEALAKDLDPARRRPGVGRGEEHLAGVLLRRVARQLEEARS